VGVEDNSRIIIPIVSPLNPKDIGAIGKIRLLKAALPLRLLEKISTASSEEREDMPPGISIDALMSIF